MRIYCVVGMHRSGTSAVSGILHMLGAALGPSGDLMEPKADNPTGFWESRSITQLHDDLLGQLGGRWDNPRFHDDGWELAPNLEPFRQRIHQLLTTHFENAEVAVWKDPRGSLLLPLWRTVTAISGTIITIRDPQSVGESLAVRQNIPLEKSAMLWLRYVGAARRADPAQFVVHYSELLEDPGKIASDLAAFVGLPPPNEELLVRLRAFVRPDLCHYLVSSEPEGPYMHLARCYHELFVIANQPHIIHPFADLLHDRWKAMHLLDALGTQSRRLLGELLPRE